MFGTDSISLQLMQLSCWWQCPHYLAYYFHVQIEISDYFHEAISRNTLTIHCELHCIDYFVKIWNIVCFFSGIAIHTSIALIARLIDTRPCTVLMK